MRWIDFQTAQRLQGRYLAGDNEALGLLYLELKRMAVAILEDFQAPRLEEMSHDAATNLITCYLKKPGFEIRNGNFKHRMLVECKNVLRGGSLEPSAGYKDRPITKARRQELSYEQIYDNELIVERSESEDGSGRTPRAMNSVPLGGGVATVPAANFLSSGEEDAPLYDGFMSYFKHYRWYRPAIKGLTQYVSKDFLLSHAVDLKRIFKEARRAEDSTQPPSGRGYQKQSKGNGAAL